jgi:hypothetical protein
MGIFDDALAKIPSTITDEVEKLKVLCDQIQREYHPIYKQSLLSYEKYPKGPNIFLCIATAGRTQDEVGALTLERDIDNKFLSCLYTLRKNDLDKKEITFKKQKVWITEEDLSDKILTEFVKIYNYLQGK